MNATRQLHDLGQSLWLDNMTRGLLTSGTLARYIREFAVTAFGKSWHQLLQRIAAKTDPLGGARAS